MPLYENQSYYQEFDGKIFHQILDIEMRIADLRAISSSAT